MATAAGAGGAGDTMTGYNFNEMSGLGNEINTIVKATEKDIQASIDADICEPMAKLWFAPEAKQFFQEFGKTVEESGNQVEKAFETFLKNVELAQDKWSEKTGGGRKGYLGSVPNCKLKVNVSMFKESDGGNVVLYERQAISYADGLKAVQDSLTKKIEGHKGELTKAVTSFLGDGQGEAVNKCFDGVLTAVGTIFDYLSVGDNSLAGQIKKAAETYKKMAEEVKTGMENAASSSGSSE